MGFFWKKRKKLERNKVMMKPIPFINHLLARICSVEN
jgi:hypothetical protein